MNTAPVTQYILRFKDASDTPVTQEIPKILGILLGTSVNNQLFRTSFSCLQGFWEFFVRN